jgi:hypothetical protein
VRRTSFQETTRHWQFEVKESNGTVGHVSELGRRGESYGVINDELTVGGEGSMQLYMFWSLFIINNDILISDYA